MKNCENCNVHVSSATKNCPLCQGQLYEVNEEISNTFPYIPTVYKQFNLFFKIAIFVSVCVVVAVVVLNTLFLHDLLLITLTIAGLIYMWSIIALAVRKRKNIGKNILYQVVILSLAAITVDYFTGFNKWSTNYFTPFLFLFALIAIAILSKILHHNVDDYIAYLIVNLVFSAIQLGFSITNLVTVTWPSLISLGFSIIFVTAILIFEGIDIKEELKKRLHL